VIQTVHGRGYRFVAELVAAAPSAPAATPLPLMAARMSEAPARGEAEEAAERWVGRAEALAVIDEALARATRGRGTTLLISGEGGIGKTSLLERASERARARGFAVYVGRCQDVPGAPPCWPWAQVVASAWSDVPDDARAALAPALAPLLPESAASAAAQVALDVPGERFRVFDAVLRLLRSLSQTRATWIVLDDLHHADASSIALAQWLSREVRGLPLVLSCSERTGTANLAGVLLHGDTELVSLSGLSQAELSQWLQAESGTAPSEARLRALHERTAGNPLYVRHLWPLLRERSEDAALPTTLREAILAHIGVLSGGEHEVLSAAAVVGETLTPALVASAAAAPIEHVIAALERARERGLLRRARVPGALGFVHGLLREALYDKLGPERRNEIHGRVAQALLDSDGSTSGVPERVAVLAYHALRAPLGMRTGEGIRLGLTAIEDAFRRGAFDRSAALCVATLEAMAACATPHPEREAVALRLASALARSGRLDAAALAFRSDRLSEPTREALQQLDVAALHESLPLVDRHLPRIVTRLYERLFAAHPAARALFRKNPSDVQERMLVEALGSVLEHLEDAPWLTETLLSLGARHTDYGVTAEMYGWVGDALLGALEEALGPAWTPACARAWHGAYEAIASTMQRGAQLALKPLPAAQAVAAARAPLLAT
jgi:hemoglobin-like flavoprotein